VCRMEPLNGIGDILTTACFYGLMYIYQTKDDRLDYNDVLFFTVFPTSHP
jgi:hypothetical protein